MRIVIMDKINSEFAVSTEDGDKIYNIINNAILNKEEIVLDFSSLDIVTTAFLNNAIGKLYNEFESVQLNKYIKIENMSGSDVFLLKKVIERAKIKFNKTNDDNSLTELIKEEFGDE